MLKVSAAQSAQSLANQHFSACGGRFVPSQCPVLAGMHQDGSSGCRDDHRGVESQRLTIHSSLIDLSTFKIIERVRERGLTSSLSRSCYDACPAGGVRGRCDNCHLRPRGSAAAEAADYAPYAPHARAA